MTRDEILEYFKDINHAYNDCTRYDTLKRMIDELQEPCEDAISRQAVLEFLKGFEILHNHDELRSNLIYGIMNMSPVTPQHCEDVPDTNVGDIYECSCGYGWDKSKVVRHHFCPNCGAKVEVEE